MTLRGPTVALHLFVADSNPTSLIARANIDRELAKFPAGVFSLHVVDVFAFPDEALAARVLVTPTLVAENCARRLIGDLSESSQVHYFLESLPGHDPNAERVPLG